jgi:hypothetical protein
MHTHMYTQCKWDIYVMHMCDDISMWYIWGGGYIHVHTVQMIYLWDAHVWWWYIYVIHMRRRIHAYIWGAGYIHVHTVQMIYLCDTYTHNAIYITYILIYVVHVYLYMLYIYTYVCWYSMFFLFFAINWCSFLFGILGQDLFSGTLTHLWKCRIAA